MFDGLAPPAELTLRTLVVLTVGVGLGVLAGWLDRVVVRGVLPAAVPSLAPRAAPAPAGAKGGVATAAVAGTSTLLTRTHRMILAPPVPPQTPQAGALGTAIPAFGLAAAVMAIAVLPFGPGLVVADTQLALLVVTLAVIVIALLPAITVRQADPADSASSGPPAAPPRPTVGLTQGVVVLLATLLPAVMMASSFSLSAIAESWQWWWLSWSIPLGALYLFAVLEILTAVRPPDRSIRGWPRATLLFTRYALVVVLAMVAVAAFLGGWSGPWSDTVGLLWTVLKFVAVLLTVLVVDQLAPSLESGAVAAARMERVRALLLPVCGAAVALVTIGVVVFG